MMDRFINAIKNNPCLWDTESDEYKSIPLKEAAWKHVIKHCDISDVREAKYLWKKLRDSHRQALKKRRSDHSWKYEELMAFLKPHLKQRLPNTTPFSMHNFENTFQSLSDSENECENSESSEPDIKKIKKSKKPKIEVVKTESDERSIEQDMLSEEILITDHNENTSLKVFFDSMAEMCKTLPEYIQIQIQRAVFSIVMDAREENIRRTNKT